MTDDSFGLRLKEERQRLGLTQCRLGSVGGVAANAQAHYERGIRSPKSDYLMAVFDVGVDVLYLLIGSRARAGLTSMSAIEQTLLQDYRSMTTLDQGAVSRISASIAGRSVSVPITEAIPTQ